MGTLGTINLRGSKGLPWGTCKGNGPELDFLVVLTFDQRNKQLRTSDRMQGRELWISSRVK